MKAYKGFDKDLNCRGFQYEIGKEYETDAAKVCATGFHSCLYPLDVFSYYPPNTSRYCEVDVSGEKSRAKDDSKVSTTKIKIGAEIGVEGLVKAAIEYTKERATEVEGGHATGYRGAASATGNYGAASATGGQGAASATGYQGAASATGSQGAASATGDQGAASATGDQGAASATGYRGAASATGDRGAASATGDLGAASATGYQGAASATGERGAASATGKACVALAAGIESLAMGEIGNAICVVERGEYDGTTHPIKAIKAAIVDGETIKPGVWYTLKDGEFVEVEAE